MDNLGKHMTLAFRTRIACRRPARRVVDRKPDQQTDFIPFMPLPNGFRVPISGDDCRIAKSRFCVIKHRPLCRYARGLGMVPKLHAKWATPR